MELKGVGLWHRGHFEINLLHQLSNVQHGAGKTVQLGNQQLSVVLFAGCQSFSTLWPILKGELARYHIHKFTNDIPAVRLSCTLDVITLGFQT